MSTTYKAIWKAEPHTIAKIDMLSEYVYQWFSILGRRFQGKNLWYVDGFAGPGEYTNHPTGSPVAAMRSAIRAFQDSGPQWIAGDVRLLFIEREEALFENLRKVLASEAPHPRVQYRSYCGEFTKGIDTLSNASDSPFGKREPVFAFIDPLGPSALSFSTVRELLSRPSCEVLVNLDSDGISRIFDAGVSAGHEKNLDSVFGDRSWEPVLHDARNQADRVQRIVQLYKANLRRLPHVDYAFSFEMRKKSHQFDYHLVFATGHPLGLEKMKEVMKKIDQTGAYCFSDAHIGQASLFSFNDPGPSALAMAAHFGGKERSYFEVRDYALNESPFVNPKSMLKFLEDSSRITVVCGNAQRRKGTYPDRLHDCIRIQF